MPDERPEVATKRTADWDSYNVGDQVAVRDPYYGASIPRRALVRAKDGERPFPHLQRRVKVRYLDTSGTAWVAASRIVGVIREASSGV